MDKSTKQSARSQTAIQLTGFLLWRFGLLLAGATGLYRISRLLLELIDLPLQIEIGIGLVFSGFILVLFSLAMERFFDLRNEGKINS